MVAGAQLNERPFPVYIVTEEFLLQGDLRFKGVAQVTLNNAEIETMMLHQVHAQALYSQNVAAQMKADELVLIRKTCQLVAFPKMLAQDDYQLRAGRRPAIVYTARFAVRGDLPLGPDDRFADVYEDLKEFFLPVLDAKVHPLVPIRPALPRQFPLALVHRDQITMLQGHG